MQDQKTHQSKRDHLERHQSELHLVVPGICGPLSDARLLEGSLQLKHWLQTLARSQASKSNSTVAGNNANNVIASIIGLTVEQDFPAAVLTAMANDIHHESLYYMLADPVHLRADMDHAILTSSDDMSISMDEAEDLKNSLNNHFAEDGLEFILLDNRRWLLSSKTKISLSTTPLLESIGRNVNFIMPEGVDAKRWRQLLTEIQMLMFSHEVNVKRESKGLLSINSVWFHGCGELTENPDDNSYRYCGDQDVLKGLASVTGSEYRCRQESVTDYIHELASETKNTVNILYLAELESLVNYTDVNPWLNQLTETLDDWVYPLLSFANKNNIKLTLHPCNSKQYQFSKYDYLKFWRYPLHKNSLNQYIESYNASNQ